MNESKMNQAETRPEPSDGSGTDQTAPSKPETAKGDISRQALVSYGRRGVLAILVLAMGYGVFKSLAFMKPDTEQNERGAESMVVETVRATAQRVDRPWLGYGTARAMDSADVGSEVAGRVIERHASIEAGQSVEPGQVLMRLDPHDFEQRLSSAQELVAQLIADLDGLSREEERLIQQVGFAQDEVNIAQRDYERTLTADAEGAGSPGGIDAKLRAQRAAARVLVALQGRLELIPSRRANLNAKLAGERANERLAQRDLDRTVITAPVGGVLQSAGPEVGEWVTVGQTVARVVDLSRLEIPLRVPVSAAGSISVGNEAKIENEGLAEFSWAGSVQRMAPEADESSRTMTLYIEVEQGADGGAMGGGLLRPGQFVMGRVIASDPVPRLLIPRRAITDDRVFVARADGEAGEGMARVVPVSVEVLYSVRGHFPGLSPDDTEWAVVSLGGELSEGDEVISSNLDQLRAGMLVDPRNAATSGAVETTVELGGP